MGYKRRPPQAWYLDAGSDPLVPGGYLFQRSVLEWLMTIVPRTQLRAQVSLHRVDFKKQIVYPDAIQRKRTPEV
jgi:hypothetical protein